MKELEQLNELKELTQKIAGDWDKISPLPEKVGDLEESQKKIVEKTDAVHEAIEQVRQDMDRVRRQQLRYVRSTKHGAISDDCARWLGGLVLLAAVNQGKAHGRDADRLLSLAADSMLVSKASLTTSDIPLPTEYSGEIVELVAEYGTARRYGTVYPLGAGTQKLPKVSTRPAFGLVAMSATVTEKSPQIAFVTFTASKWGGLVRLPAEIDEDSIVSMGQFLARYSAIEMAKLEDTVFWTADGSATYDNLEGFTKAVVTLSKVEQLATGKTAPSDATLTNFRALRTKVDTAVLGRAAYYVHPTWEQHFAGFNSGGDKPYVANGINGASLDGFPIRWVDVLPPYSTSASASTVFALFGDPSYMYLGTRGGMRFDTSREAGFTTDEILVRALERFTIGLMADGAVAGLQTAAS